MARMDGRSDAGEDARSLSLSLFISIAESCFLETNPQKIVHAHNRHNAQESQCYFFFLGLSH